MPISYTYDETRALAKQLRELTGRDIKHTEIIAAMATVKGLKPDAMMHALKADRPETQTWSMERHLQEGVYFGDSGIRGVLKREAGSNRSTCCAIGLFDISMGNTSKANDLNVIRAAVRTAFRQISLDSRYVVGLVSSRYAAIALTGLPDDTLLGPAMDSALQLVPHNVDIDYDTLRFALVGSAAIIRTSDDVDAAIDACIKEMPIVVHDNPASTPLHEWRMVRGWEHQRAA